MISTLDLSKIYLAFDIHNVLAESSADSVSLPLFQAYGHILRVQVDGNAKKVRHYLYPFVKELFQLIAQTPGIEIAFATSSKLAFAKPFVQEFLTACLGEEKSKSTLEKVMILAREQLRDNKHYKNVLSSRHSRHGNYRKDLEDVFPNVPNKQKVLIEDDPSYAAPHQAKNVLYVDGSDWTRRFKDYQNYGIGFYYCLSQVKFERRKKAIESENAMALFHNPSNRFRLAYCDKEGVKEIEFSQEESLKIAYLYKQSIDEQTIFLFNKAFIKEAKEALHLEEDVSNLLICGKQVAASRCKERAEKGDVVFQLTQDEDVIVYRKSKNNLSLKESKLAPLLSLIFKKWEEESPMDFFTKETNNDSAKSKLYSLVWDKVKNQLWKEQFIAQANHVLLIAGAIFSAFDASKKTTKPITKILFNWQCSKKEGAKKFDFEALSKREDLYQKGLELLRKINPQLEPITLKSFEAALASHPTLPDDGAEELQSCSIS